MSAKLKIKKPLSLDIQELRVFACDLRIDFVSP